MIVGKDVSLIEQLLRVLTYFIRCSELAENTEVCPSLTADVDDTLTLMSTSDIATPISGLAADVTLSSSCSTSTSDKSASPVSAEKLQHVTSADNCEFVLKPAPTGGRGTHVRFENGVDGACRSSTGAPSSTNENCSSAVASDCFAFSHSAVTTSTVSEQSVPLVDASQLVSEPHLLFCSDVSDALPSLLGVTCSGCSPIQPCEECNMIDYSKLKNLGKRNGDVITSENVCNLSDVPSDSGARAPARTDCKENFRSSSSPVLCQLSPTQANENVRVERVAHVGRQQVEKLKPKLFHVPLEKPDISSPYLGRSNPNIPVLASDKHSPVKSSKVVRYERSNSMFDEYFDGISSCPVIELCSDAGGKSAFSRQQDDTSTLDEIMNELEPCPDVSHIDVSHLSSSSSSSEVLADQVMDGKVASVFHPPLDDTVPPCSRLQQMVPDPSLPMKLDKVFVEQHFAAENSEQHLDDIPDGPSKQMISSAIKLMQDVCLDCTSQAGVDDLADIPASDYFSQPGLGPSRGRQRHPSGQSNTSARCWYDNLTLSS